MEDRPEFYNQSYTQISFRASKSKVRERKPFDLKISKLDIDDEVFKQQFKVFVEKKIMEIVSKVLPENKALKFKNKKYLEDLYKKMGLL